jgi:hypothetical protein
MKKAKLEHVTVMTMEEALKLPITIQERVRRIEMLEELEVPHNVRVSAGIRISLFGSQICFSDDGDYLSLADAREVVQWLTEQLGGKVKWESNQKPKQKGK